MNKKKKSTNISPYPDEVIDRLARAFYPAILACWNSEEGQREFAAWQAEQAHHANNEKQEVPAGELPVVHIAIVCGFWQGASGWKHPVFVLLHPPMVLTAYSCRRNCVKLTQFLLSPCGSIGEITLGIFQRLFQKFLQLIRIIIHPMVRLRKFNIVVWNVVQNVRSH